MKVFIENEAGRTIKNIFNEKSLRFIRSTEVAAPYPYPYGFILDTTSGDGDNVDCFVITERKLKTGTIIDVEPLALLEMYEDNELDHKIIAQLKDENVSINESIKASLVDFLYTVFSHIPNKEVQVRDFHDQQSARQFIERSLDL